jgi:hypothetical protein
MKPVANQNLAFHYTTGFPIEVKGKVLEIGDDLSVFIHVNFRKLSAISDFRNIWENLSLPQLRPLWHNNQRQDKIRSNLRYSSHDVEAAAESQQVEIH